MEEIHSTVKVVECLLGSLHTLLDLAELPNIDLGFPGLARSRSYLIQDRSCPSNR